MYVNGTRECALPKDTFAVGPCVPSVHRRYVGSQTSQLTRRSAGALGSGVQAFSNSFPELLSPRASQIFIPAFFSTGKTFTEAGK